VTETESRLGEMNYVKNSLQHAAAEANHIVDARMRSTVKELLAYQYAPTAETVEVVKEIDSFINIIESADIFSDIIFGMDSSKNREFKRRNYEWNKARPVRLYDYVQKLADIFPAQHLIKMIHSCKSMPAEELIDFYEANKGEARQSDYGGKPTGIDLSVFVSKAIVLRIK
jgi:hypothetical protein